MSHSPTSIFPFPVFVFNAKLKFKPSLLSEEQISRWQQLGFALWKHEVITTTSIFTASYNSLQVHSLDYFSAAYLSKFFYDSSYCTFDIIGDFWLTELAVFGWLCASVRNMHHTMPDSQHYNAVVAGKGEWDWSLWVYLRNKGRLRSCGQPIGGKNLFHQTGQDGFFFWEIGSDSPCGLFAGSAKVWKTILLYSSSLTFSPTQLLNQSRPPGWSN